MAAAATTTKCLEFRCFTKFAGPGGRRSEERGRAAEQRGACRWYCRESQLNLLSCERSLGETIVPPG